MLRLIGWPAVAIALGMAASACTPALDWRELRPDGSQALVMFPCKPASHARRVVLAGSTIEMSMYACTAGDTVYALSFADVVEPARVGVALGEMATAVRTNVQSASAAASAPVNVRGMTPHPQAVQWQLVGKLPDGRAVQERAALFSQGTRVYQATMLGARLDSDAQDSFFGSLRVGL